MPVEIQSLLPSITDIGLLACLSIVYGELSRVISDRKARSVTLGFLFGLISLVSSLYHAAGGASLLADNGAIFVGLAAAFLGMLGALTALGFAFLVGVALGTNSPIEPVQLILACAVGTLWHMKIRGLVRSKLLALIVLGALLNAALLPSYIWAPDTASLAPGVALQVSLLVNLAISLLFGAFVERERGMLEAELHLRQMANTDQLTGLHNRRTLIAAFDSRPRKAKGHALLLIDVDNFKSVNDAHGHAAGDEVLRHISRHLQDIVRSGDIVCRIGGEEFAVLLQADSWEEAQAAGERLRSEVERHRVRIAQLALQVTVSIGIAWWRDETTFDRELAAADEALYRAKRGGRNCTRLAVERSTEEQVLQP
ncbi:diguanylate cyclase [Devosia lucknowensis]|uniref:diguanylate cyclase n=1 Tax=Devosia lucknowensis TaxID=1096929 RepID=A0A1Y6EGS3_9HYPH|nr:GGDEF domain-containing protein [Devosia lucknowensis]SMQ60120.1 diguanylate cyclase [Devosia lucknowensis]